MSGAKARTTFLAVTLGLLAPVVLAQTATAASPKPTLAPGDAATAFPTMGLNDVPYTIDFPKDGPTTVLLFFVSTCPHCQAMIPHWNEHFEKKPEKLKVLGVMLDQGSSYFFSANKISFPVVRAVQPRELYTAFKINGVPMAVRVKPGGVVEGTAVGEPDLAKLADLFKPAGGAASASGKP